MTWRREWFGGQVVRDVRVEAMTSERFSGGGVVTGRVGKMLEKAQESFGSFSLNGVEYLVVPATTWDGIVDEVNKHGV